MRIVLSVLAVFAAGIVTQAHAEIDWAKVDQTIGRPSLAQPDGVHRFGLPRSDLRVAADGVAIRPAFALGSWLAFEPMGDDAKVMGDLVLTQIELNPVMTRLAQGGIQITAIHNHLLRAEPMTLYMHIDGHGNALKLAETLRAALNLTGTPPPAVGTVISGSALDGAALDRVLGRVGKANGDVYQFTIPRAEAIMDEDMVHHRRGHGGSCIHGHRHSHQFPACGRRTRRRHRRFCADRRRSESGAGHAAPERHRGDGLAQPHAE
jgi:hypothetical protein